MAMAEYSNCMLNRKAQMLAALSTQEIEAVHGFLKSRMGLELQPSCTWTLDKSSVFLTETPLPQKKGALEFLDKEQNVVQEPMLSDSVIPRSILMSSSVLEGLYHSPST